LRRELGLPPNAFVVGCVGRVVPIKCVPAVVRAFAGLAHSDPRAHLVVIGDGPERGLVEDEVRRLSLGGRVHLLGWRRDLPAIYADVDLLALASRNEGTPLAIVEAFAAGVPVVATAVGGVPDMFPRAAADDERPPSPPGVDLRPQGALVAPEDDVALTDALRLFASHPTLRDAAAKRARAAAQAYDGERLIGDTATLYRSLLDTVNG
jgi:glycosyltransferase involved in cell wall biosynthesis